MRPWRYDDEARTFGESLAEIKVAEPVRPEPNVGALERILRGETALGKMAAGPDLPHAEAGLPEELQKHELKKKLQALLSQKQHKIAAERAGVATFVRSAEKLANPIGPDITPGQMTSGNGSPSAMQQEPASETSGTSSQGPAADLIARALKKHHETQRKVAASRLDKEVALGNVGYHQVDPRIPASMGQSGFGKGLSRQSAFEPSPVAPEALERRRALNDAVFRNQHTQADAARGAISQGSPSQATINSANLHNKNLQGMGPATHPGLGIGAPAVYAPDTAGQLVRTMSTPGTLPKARAAASIAMPQHGEVFLNPRQPVDSTLNRAVMEHELGERDTMTRRIDGKQVLHNHASHAGVAPILRENIVNAGDPEAIQTMRNVRGMHSDDAMMQRLTRQAGHHPDAPLPVGGRHQRSLEKMLERNSGKIDKGVRGKSLGQHLTNAIHFGADNNTEIRTIPQHVRDATSRAVSSAGELKAHMGQMPTEGLLARGKHVLGGLSKARKLIPDAATISRYLR